MKTDAFAETRAVIEGDALRGSEAGERAVAATNAALGGTLLDAGISAISLFPGGAYVAAAADASKGIFELASAGCLPGQKR